MLNQSFFKLWSQAAQIVCRVQFAVDNLPTFFTQGRCEMPHGTQKNRGALLGRHNMSGLLINFSHPHSILLWIEVAEG